MKDFDFIHNFRKMSILVKICENLDFSLEFRKA